MNKFLNIKSEGSMATVFLYGDIGGYDGGITDAQIIRELKDAESVYKRIEVRINSRGGDVYTGIAIFNALAASKSDISIYVDGIAASMASVIALCGKPLFMSKYARLMIHSVSGGCYGTKNEIRDACEQMESLEETLCEMYSKRIGKTSEEIKALYFDGADHYLKASEALELGFVDGIYDAEPVPEDSTPEQIYTLLNNRLDRPQNNNNMNFLERIKKHRLFNNVASDDDILVEIEKLETGAGKVPVLESRVAELEKELTAFRDREKADEDAARKKTLDDAVSDGRLKELRAAIPATLRANPALRILMSVEDFDTYDDELTDLMAKGKDDTDVNAKRYKGIAIETLANWPQGLIVATPCSHGADGNLFAAVNLQDDENVIQVEKWAPASELYFFKMLMKADTNIGFGEEFVALDWRTGGAFAIEEEEDG